MYTIHEGTSPQTMTDEEREKVREQLNRLLETHHFKNSRRYPPLLRFIVEETLAGRGDFLKERLLGMRVFDRPADYDTAADPIVRVTIAEIRKRIAQYYHDEEHDAEMRIELLPGRYAPEFRARGHRPEVAAGGAAALLPSPAEIAELHAMGVPPAAHEAGVPSPEALHLAPPPAAGARRPQRRWYALAAAVALASGLLGGMGWRSAHPEALDQMWSPLIASPRAILVCVPTDVGLKRGASGEPEEVSKPLRDVAGDPAGSPSGPTFLQWQALGENVVYSDMLATLKIGNVLAERHHDYRARLAKTITLEDLRQGPSVLIGGLDNQWTMRALAPLQFRFAGSDEDRYWIADRKNPAFRDWSLDLKVKYASVTRDYAIVARLHNEQTGQPQVIVAGIGTSGTAAAGEFLGDARRMKELGARVGTGFKDRDFEAVLSTDVVNGVAGAPKIVAVATW